MSCRSDDRAQALLIRIRAALDILHAPAQALDIAYIEKWVKAPGLEEQRQGIQ